MQFLKKFAILLLSFYYCSYRFIFLSLCKWWIIQAKSAILINANSGEIVYKNEETPVQSICFI